MVGAGGRWCLLTTDKLIFVVVKSLLINYELLVTNCWHKMINIYNDVYVDKAVAEKQC